MTRGVSVWLRPGLALDSLHGARTQGPCVLSGLGPALQRWLWKGWKQQLWRRQTGVPGHGRAEAMLQLLEERLLLVSLSF